MFIHCQLSTPGQTFPGNVEQLTVAVNLNLNPRDRGILLYVV